VEGNSLVEGLDGEEGEKLPGSGRTPAPGACAAALCVAEEGPSCGRHPRLAPSNEAGVGRGQAGESRNLAIEVVSERVHEGTELLGQAS
jgi:hypothetical protein